MKKEILEEIGLTKSEINTYLALLDLGSSATGKIVDKSGASSSKIYEILDRLMQKGLVSYVVKAGVKYFEAAPPERIMDYMKDKEARLKTQTEELKKIVPELELKRKLSKYKSEATIFKGMKGAETAFRILINSMEKKDEWLGYVINFQDPKYFHLLTKLHVFRSKKGLKSRIILDESVKKFGEAREKIPRTQVKYVAGEIHTPAVVNVAGDTVLLNIMAKEVTVFMIKNKEVADSFRVQFEKWWDEKAKAYEGQEAVEAAYAYMMEIAKPNDEVVIFAAKPATKRGADYNVKWNRDIRKKVKNVRLLYYGDSEINRKRAKELEEQGCEAKLLLTAQTLPISTVILGDTIVNTVWGKKPVAFKIQNKEVADSFRENFEQLWNQDTRVVKGMDAIQELFEDMLESGSCDLIGARGYFIDRRPKYIDGWEKRAIKKGFKMRNIVDPEIKGNRNTKFPFVETKYTLPKEFANLSVIWIYGNKVAISNWVEKEPIAVIIENKALHDMYKTQFELLWKRKVHF